MTITVNLAGVEAWRGSGGVLPPGWHLCQIESADDTRPSRNAHPQLIVEWSAVDGEHAGLGITEWLVVTEGSKGKVKAFLDAVAIPTPDGEVQIEPAMLRGRRALILVREEPDRTDPTKLRSRVKAHDAAPGLAPMQSAPASASMVRNDHTPF